MYLNQTKQVLLLLKTLKNYNGAHALNLLKEHEKQRGDLPAQGHLVHVTLGARTQLSTCSPILPPPLTAAMTITRELH